jgi:pyroglutamyl-peptidase
MRLKIVVIGFLFFILCFSSFSSSISINYNEKEKTQLNSKVLVTGFGPFSNFEVNPSELLAIELNGQKINEAEIIGIPVFVNLSNFSESIDIVINAIEEHKPILIISIGLAASSKWIRIEKVGINLKREKINEEKLSFEKINTKGKWFYISSLNSIKIVKELRANDIKSRVSLYAGLSLCNGLLYSTLEYIQQKCYNIDMGFVHIPLHKTEENPDAMELSTMINAINITIQESLKLG